LPETESPVKVLFGILDMVNREKPVFPEELFGSFGSFGHVNEYYPESLAFELRPPPGNITDSLPAERTAEIP
jgi:hypothetical protein